MKEQLANIMRFQAYGFENRKNKDFIISELALVGVHLNERQFRKLYSEISSEYLLGSSNDGYFMINKESDFNTAIAELEEKVEALCIRKNKLKSKYAERFGEEAQPALF